MAQILKCEKLYHGEIGLINRTFGAARRTRVVDRQVARLPFLNRRPMTSDASIELTGERPARNRQSHGSSCDCRVPVAHLLVALRASTDRPSPSTSPLPKSPFSGGDEPM
jgi:hypothetical protein